MIEENRKLLLTDLCARLPYEVYAETINEFGETHINRISSDNINLVFTGWFKECKLYLRPMSTMTEEEKEEYINIKQGECNGCVLTGKGDPNTEFLLVDFFNAHHFDYRGLIEKGLALEAPKGMYSIKEQ